MTLPVALSGTDVIGQAKTGTGKTLGFGLPLLERVTVPADVEAGRARPEALTDTPQALVVVPTRELCTQVTNDLLTAGKVRNVRVTAIYGGRAYEPQVEALKKGVDVVVGTPGRLLDLAGQKKLNLKHVKCLVLDEADEMLDLGFLPDVEKIIDMLPVKRQTMLFSATMPGAVIGLARRYMSRPTHIRATAPDDEGATVANIKQFVYRAHNMDKPEMVARILQADGRELAMIFCRTKRTAADIAEQLQRRGFASGAVHGDLGQGAREQALRAFRNGKVDVLVCTDVAARGIDVEGVTHVINYQSPEDEKTYLHRVGRTGRAGAKGTAITFVDWDDIPRWQLINKALELDFNDPVETYSSSPHLFSDLGIPEGTKGTLPRSERTRAGLDAEELEDLGETGGRGARGRGGRGDRSEERTADRERPARTPRRRRRTRNGAPVDSASGEASVESTPTTGETGAVQEPDATRTPRRRRRIRGGVPAQPVAAEAVPAEATSVVEPVTAPSTGDERSAQTAQAAVTTAEGPALDAPESPAKPRRRRTRKSAEQVAATPEAPAAAAAEAPEPTETAVAEATPRRRTRKTSEPAEAAVATAEGAEDSAQEAKPRRTRKRAAAAAEAAADAVDTVETATEAKPRRRTRKATAETVVADTTAQMAEETDAAARSAADPAATAQAQPRRRTRKAAEAPAPTEVAEAAVDTAEAVEAKPRRRTRKATVGAQAPEAPGAADAAGAAETSLAKPRRTRKTAAAEAAADTAEAVEAKPRRTRKATAETAVETAEGAEAKPRRRTTRKTAAAEVAVDTAEAAEAKPRRTRKAAAAPEAAADVADGAAEAKPRRRTRKATAETVTAEIPAQTTGEPETKPRRRTRKAAEAGEASGDAVEAKPTARRTRKTAAAVESAEA
ncbi:DEAD/DEAH box helicase [Streptomyces sp. NPDC046197]|uniref:DEAD/DEAH box helicase n=1 Tax=Streptomyces sp. NPDC046197 TaxID=3154337 RepID=UPI0033CB4D88